MKIFTCPNAEVMPVASLMDQNVDREFAYSVVCFSTLKQNSELTNPHKILAYVLLQKVKQSLYRPGQALRVPVG